jgi:hypothetical protein
LTPEIPQKDNKKTNLVQTAVSSNRTDREHQTIRFRQPASEKKHIRKHAKHIRQHATANIRVFIKNKKIKTIRQSSTWDQMSPRARENIEFNIMSLNNQLTGDKGKQKITLIFARLTEN